MLTPGLRDKSRSITKGTTEPSGFDESVPGQGRVSNLHRKPIGHLVHLRRNSAGRCPLLSALRTQLRHRGMSEKSAKSCHSASGAWIRMQRRKQQSGLFLPGGRILMIAQRKRRAAWEEGIQAARPRRSAPDRASRATTFSRFSPQQVEMLP
jgi:hypothetical protein